MRTRCVILCMSRPHNVGQGSTASYQSMGLKSFQCLLNKMCSCWPQYGTFDCPHLRRNSYLRSKSSRCVWLAVHILCECLLIYRAGKT